MSRVRVSTRVKIMGKGRTMPRFILIIRIVSSVMRFRARIRARFRVRIKVNILVW
jgi:hypothetical protein